MVPHTVLGKVISSFVMILGYAIIAVPTGIVTVEMSKSGLTGRKCSNCESTIAKSDNYCKNCGTPLDE